MSEMKVYPAFTNFIAIDNITIDPKPIENFCYELQKNDRGRIISNLGGWQSNDIKLGDILPQLFYEVKERVDELHFYFEFKDELVSTIDNCWVNINKNGDSNAVHDHGQGLFSGVYYVKSEKDSGDIVLRTPVAAHSYAITQDFIKTNNPFNSSIQRFTPKTGDLVLFPSWILHYVEPNLSGEDRISIAFNTYLK